jgi:cytochrome c
MHRRSKSVAAALMLTVLLTSRTANAQPEMLTFAQNNNCMSCHSNNRDSLGPSFEKIAQRYKDVANADKILARRIAEGGVGNWGIVPMPANTQITPDQALALADWILSLH